MGSWRPTGEGLGEQWQGYSGQHPEAQRREAPHFMHTGMPGLGPQGAGLGGKGAMGRFVVLLVSPDCCF